jgi:hypothetical protein
MRQCESSARYKTMTNDGYEEAGLSSLERLIGREVTIVSFVQDYLEIAFDDDLIFTCYTWPIVDVGDNKFRYGQSGYADALCRLIGQSPQSVKEVLRQELSIHFVGGDSVFVSLQHEDALGPEAAKLHKLGGTLLVVW